MKSTKFVPFIVLFVLAVAGFFILPMVNEAFAACGAVFAIGIILGGITVSMLTPSTSSSSDDEERQTLYVGNLPYRANETIVRELFEKYGNVYSVRLVKDKQTGRRRGFGFVTMNAQGAKDAMGSLNDNEFQERVLKVREAKEKTSLEDSSQASE
ncbi:MAG: RNA-binding protein [Gammaproteobacteria bacterium]|nr:RNA-binding protein [Gammaproteobacteria bacterium]